MQNILASYYSNGTQLDVALCSNDSTALGVTQAIESDYAGTNTPIITGQDGDEANLKNIVNGKQSMNTTSWPTGCCWPYTVSPCRALKRSPPRMPPRFGRGIARPTRPPNACRRKSRCFGR